MKVRLWSVAIRRLHPVRVESSRARLLSVALGAASLVGLMSPSHVAWSQTAPPTGRPQLELAFQKQNVYGVAWSPDGATLASGDTHGLVRLWDTRTGALRHTLGEVDHFNTVYTVAFSGDSKLLASGDSNKKLKLWNVQTGALVRNLTQQDADIAHERDIYSVAWSPDGKTLASGSLDTTVAIWDVTTGARLYTLKGHQKEVKAVAFSPDGATLASGGEDDLKLWDAHTGAPKAGLMPFVDSVRDLAWSPDGTLLAIGVNPVMFWDARTQQVLHKGKIPVLPWLGAVEAVAFSPDGNLVATGHGFPAADSRECDVRLWDAHSAELKQTLRGHKLPVMGLTFSPDGKSLASVSLEGTLKVWPVAGGRSPVTLVPLPDGGDTPPGNWIAMTDEGFYDVSLAPTKAALKPQDLKWRVGKDEFPLETFERAFRRPDVVQRLLKPEPIAANSEIGLLLASRSAPPAVAFLAPADKARVQGDSVSVQVVVSDDVGVEKIEFRVNGRPVTVAFSAGATQAITEANRGQALGGKPAPASHNVAIRYNTTIPLPPGESKILVRVIARDASGLEGAADIHVERELMARGAALSTLRGEAAREAVKLFQGNLHVLTVGVGRYKNPAYNLGYTVADAAAFAALWPTMKDRLYQNVLLTQLEDAKATAPAVQAELEKLIKTTTNKDTVLIFLAGHGLQADGENFYFATHEVDFEHPQTTALPWTALTDVLARVPAKRVVLFLDACHSGAALGTRASNERMAENLVKRAGVMVFASSRGDQVSFESAEWKHGAFTKAVLEGIADDKANLDLGDGKDGNITVAELLVYLQGRVPKLTAERQQPACPLMQDFGEPFRLTQQADATG